MKQMSPAELRDEVLLLRQEVEIVDERERSYREGIQDILDIPFEIPAELTAIKLPSDHPRWAEEERRAAENQAKFLYKVIEQMREKAHEVLDK